MSDIAIHVEALSKRYRLGGNQPFNGNLRELLANAFTRPLRRTSPMFQSSLDRGSNGDHSIWALKNISFKIRCGEIVGVIGRNGAGKSTLLKILSRITEPTTGFADIRGRVGSLLEVGTGFNLELSGRENIYLSGAILGMKKAEIDRKFDQMVDFAEVEKFLDTPVKHYSSGMYLRLAFAVIAHLEQEVLLVDEVLAVGDAAFRRKCMGRMGEVGKEGKTVLVVSHNMRVIQSLCSKSVLIQDGRLAIEGPTSQVIAKYFASVEKLREQSLESRTDRSGGKAFQFTSMEFLNPETGLPCTTLISGHPVLIRIGYINLSQEKLQDVGIAIGFGTLTGTHLFGCRSRAVGVTFDIDPGRGTTDCVITKWPFKAGRYSYNLIAERRDNIVVDGIADAGSFDVEASDYYGTGYLPAPSQPGLLIDYSWEK
jgi:lipopolysaccharide transport system ATP-binding protein